ncbi:MAG: glycosyltransferase [Myxococcales bacterium]|nr:glycosyltransferase [Myxococcales bacterium]
MSVGDKDVTVLVPVYNAMPHLHATWRSLRRSRGLELDFVFVDDGSTDGSLAYLRAIARCDPRVRVIARSKNGGIVSALNDGLAATNTPLVARCDADDLVHPDRFALQREALLSIDLDVCGTGIRCFPLVGLGGGLLRYERWQNGLLSHDDLMRDRFVESPFVHPSVMFRRAAVQRVGGYRDVGFPEDYDLWLRLAEAGACFGKIPRVLTYWRDHPRRLTRTAAYCEVDAVLRCRLSHLGVSAVPPGRPVFIAGTGDDGKRLARHLPEHGWPLQAFLDISPRRLGQRIAGVPVMTLSDALPAIAAQGAVVLVALGAEGRRGAARAELLSSALVELRDFFCVA